MSNPRHPGSRLVDHPPNLLRALHRLEARVTRLAGLSRPEILTFVPADPARGEPCTSPALTAVLETRMYRSGAAVLADVAAGTGAASEVEVRLTAPSVGAFGASTTSPAGGGEYALRVRLDLPPAWEPGAAHLIFLEGRRASGTDDTTVRMLRAWQI